MIEEHFDSLILILYIYNYLELLEIRKCLNLCMYQLNVICGRGLVILVNVNFSLCEMSDNNGSYIVFQSLNIFLRVYFVMNTAFRFCSCLSLSKESPCLIGLGRLRVHSIRFDFGSNHFDSDIFELDSVHIEKKHSCEKKVNIVSIIALLKINMKSV